MNLPARKKEYLQLRLTLFVRCWPLDFATADYSDSSEEYLRAMGEYESTKSQAYLPHLEVDRAAFEPVYLRSRAYEEEELRRANGEFSNFLVSLERSGEKNPVTEDGLNKASQDLRNDLLNHLNEYRQKQGLEAASVPIRYEFRDEVLSNADALLRRIAEHAIGGGAR